MIFHNFIILVNELGCLNCAWPQCPTWSKSSPVDKGLFSDHYYKGINEYNSLIAEFEHNDFAAMAVGIIQNC